MSDAPKEPAAPADSPADDSGKTELSLEKHKQLLDEKKKIQAEKARIEKELNEYKAKEREKEEADAKKRGDFESILKSRDEELEKIKSELSGYKERISYSQKMTAVLDAIGTKIEDKWLSLIDADKVIINPATNEIDQASVTKLVENLRKDWPEMLKKQSGNLPDKAPQGGDGGTISRSAWLKLTANEMKKYRPDQVLD